MSRRQKHDVWAKYGLRLCRAMHLKSGTAIKPQQKSTTFASLPSIKPLPLKSSDLLEAWQKRSKTKPRPPNEKWGEGIECIRIGAQSIVHFTVQTQVP